MAVAPDRPVEPFFNTNREEMRRLVEEIDARAGVRDELAVPIERLREMQAALGIDPEARVGSRELMQMRYGDAGDRV